MKYLTIAICAALLASPAEARDLTLSEALSLAHGHSLELKVALTREQAALASVSAAKRARFPSLSIGGTVTAVDDLPAVKFDLPVGPPIEKELGSREMYQLDASLTLPLYTGGRLGGAIDQAEAVARVKRALALAEADRVSLSVRIDYYSLALADNMMRAAEASLERAGIISRNVRSMFAAGAADSVDLLEADLAVTEASFGLSSARIERRSAEIRLQVLLGIDTSETLVIPSPPAPPRSLPEGPEETPGRPELAAAAAMIEAGEAVIGITGSERLPSVSLFGGYSIGKPNRDMFNAGNDDYFRVGAGLNWSFNLGGATARRMDAARLELSSLRLDRERIQRDIGEAVSLAREQMRLAHERYLSSRERLELTTRSYRLAGKRHTGGDLPTNRLLEIEKSLTAAQADLAASEAAYYLRYSGWLYAIGSEELEKGKI